MSAEILSSLGPAIQHHPVNNENEGSGQSPIKKLSDARINNAVGKGRAAMSHEPRGSNDDTGKKQQGKKKMTPKSRKHISFTDWAIAAFTAVLAGVAFLQWKTTASQLNVMKNDERAWVKIEINYKDAKPNFTLRPTAGEPLRAIYKIINSGKSPAKSVVVYGSMVTVPTDEPVPLENMPNGKPGSKRGDKYGIVFPDETLPPSIFTRTDAQGGERNSSYSEGNGRS